MGDVCVSNDIDGRRMMVSKMGDDILVGWASSMGMVWPSYLTEVMRQAEQRGDNVFPILSWPVDSILRFAEPMYGLVVDELAHRHLDLPDVSIPPASMHAFSDDAMTLLDECALRLNGGSVLPSFLAAQQLRAQLFQAGQPLLPVAWMQFMSRLPGLSLQQLRIFGPDAPEFLDSSIQVHPKMVVFGDVYVKRSNMPTIHILHVYGESGRCYILQEEHARRGKVSMAIKTFAHMDAYVLHVLSAARDHLPKMQPHPHAKPVGVGVTVAPAPAPCIQVTPMAPSILPILYVPRFSLSVVRAPAPMPSITDTTPVLVPYRNRMVHVVEARECPPDIVAPSVSIPAPADGEHRVDDARMDDASTLTEEHAVSVPVVDGDRVSTEGPVVDDASMAGVSQPIQEPSVSVPIVDTDHGSVDLPVMDRSSSPDADFDGVVDDVSIPSAMLEDAPSSGGNDTTHGGGGIEAAVSDVLEHGFNDTGEHPRGFDGLAHVADDGAHGMAPGLIVSPNLHDQTVSFSDWTVDQRQSVDPTLVRFSHHAPRHRPEPARPSVSLGPSVGDVTEDMWSRAALDAIRGNTRQRGDRFSRNLKEALNDRVEGWDNGSQIDRVGRIVMNRFRMKGHEGVTGHVDTKPVRSRILSESWEETDVQYRRRIRSEEVLYASLKLMPSASIAPVPTADQVMAQAPDAVLIRMRCLMLVLGWVYNTPVEAAMQEAGIQPSMIQSILNTRVRRGLSHDERVFLSGRPDIDEVESMGWSSESLAILFRFSGILPTIPSPSELSNKDMIYSLGMTHLLSTDTPIVQKNLDMESLLSLVDVYRRLHWLCLFYKDFLSDHLSLSCILARRRALEWLIAPRGGIFFPWDKVSLDIPMLKSA